MIAVVMLQQGFSENAEVVGASCQMLEVLDRERAEPLQYK